MRLHADKNPSLRINPIKGVWYCHGCAVGGDSIRFVQLAEGLDFRGALKFLGMGDDSRPPDRFSRRREISAAWARAQIQKMNMRLRELDEEIEIADEAGDAELAESFWREKQILGTMRDDLREPKNLSDFVQIKDTIEKITASFE